MLMLTLSRQSCIDPVLLTSCVVAHVCVSQRRQFTGSVLGSVSSRLGTVDHNVRCLIGQKRWSKLRYLVGRQIDCTRQMRVLISSGWQGFDQRKSLSAINLHL